MNDILTPEQMKQARLEFAAAIVHGKNVTEQGAMAFRIADGLKALAEKNGNKPMAEHAEKIRAHWEAKLGEASPA